MYRHVPSAPVSSLPPERRGAVVGRFCLGCHSVYPRYARRHAGKPTYGRDHVSSPCAHEGEIFTDDAEWWEDAVEVLPSAPAGAA